VAIRKLNELTYNDLTAMAKAMTKAQDFLNAQGNEEFKDNIIINVLMKSVVFYQHKLPRGHRMEMARRVAERPDS
jgi:diadenosine tetraphosphate (Ap4A) HIT family hydrolase